MLQLGLSVNILAAQLALNVKTDQRSWLRLRPKLAKIMTQEAARRLDVPLKLYEVTPR